MKFPWRVTAVFTAMILLAALGAACGTNEAEPRDSALPASVSSNAAAPAAPKEEPGEVTSVVPFEGGMMLPRPDSVESLVAQSDVIVSGTISSLIEEKMMYYGEDGRPVITDGDSGSPYTDYEVQIEYLLKGDSGVEESGKLVLRMYGHQSKQANALTLASVQLPQPGSRYLFALDQNPDDTYGSGAEGLIYIDGETVTYADGIAFSTELTGEEFVQAVRIEIGREKLDETSVKTALSDSEVVLSEDDFKDLITVDDVESRLSAKVSLEANFRDFKKMSGQAVSSQAGNIDSWYGMTVEFADNGAGMTFSVMDFDSDSSAEDYYVTVMNQTSELRQMNPPVGTISGQAELNSEGIGSMLIFNAGDKIVSMHTTYTEDRSPLMTLHDLEELAALIVSRL